MVKTICDRCGRVQDTTGEKYVFDIFYKVLHYDICPECNGKYLVLLEEFIKNKNQTTEVNTNEQEKTSNT